MHAFMPVSETRKQSPAYGRLATAALTCANACEKQYAEIGPLASLTCIYVTPRAISPAIGPARGENGYTSARVTYTSGRCVPRYARPTDKAPPWRGRAHFRWNRLQLLESKSAPPVLRWRRLETLETAALE